MNELEVKKDKIAGVITNFLAMQELKYTVPMPEEMVIKDNEDMKLADKNYKLATSELNRILEYTSKAKQTIDGFKAPILVYEKDITARAEKVKNFIKGRQQAYLARVKAEQDAINGVVNLIRETFHKLECTQKTRDVKLKKCMDDLDLGIQKIKIENNTPIEMTADAIEILEEIEQKIEYTPVIAEPEFIQANVVQTRAIEEKFSYSIGDKKAFVAYAIKNNLWEMLLKIEPVLTTFKAWVKLDNNANLPFVKKELSLK